MCWLITLRVSPPARQVLVKVKKHRSHHQKIVFIGVALVAICASSVVMIAGVIPFLALSCRISCRVDERAITWRKFALSSLLGRDLGIARDLLGEKYSPYEIPTDNQCLWRLDFYLEECESRETSRNAWSSKIMTAIAPGDGGSLGRPLIITVLLVSAITKTAVDCVGGGGDCIAWLVFQTITNNRI